MCSRECEADRTGQRLSRDERKELRKADLADCPPERRRELREKTLKTLAYLKETHETAKRNGVPIDDNRLRRNCASHELMLECLNEIG